MDNRCIVLTFTNDNTKIATHIESNSLVSSLITSKEEFENFIKLGLPKEKLAAYVTLKTPFEVIKMIEKARRAPGPGMFGPPVGMFAPATPTINVRPEFGMGSVPTPEDAQVKSHVHNDMEAHSPLYMFGCVILIALVGFALWLNFIKDSVSQTRKGREEPRDISLSRFNKSQ